MTGVVVQDASARIAGAADAEAFVASTCFKTGPPRLLGVELEWFLHDTRNPRDEMTAERLALALGPHTPVTIPGGHALPLPGGSAVTVEPGGQVELSSSPARSLTDCVDLVAADLEVLSARLARHGLALHGAGADRHRAGRRVLDAPRYVAMERHFAPFGDAGRAMMCSTAAVQVCVDTGVDPAERWDLLHRVGPVLVAMFAHSAVQAGRLTGWRSSRQAIWSRLEPARTRGPVVGGDPAEGYARFALDAPLLCCRRAGDWSVPDGVTFRDWLGGAFGPPPTYGDLAYHLTTLFPPVRPQGRHLEVRYLDQQAGDGWQVATAVVAALVGDARAADLAGAAAEAAAGRWEQAARDALTDPVLRRAAGAIADVTRGALARLGASSRVRDTVEDFLETYTDRGRCPADDDIDPRRPL